MMFWLGLLLLCTPLTLAISVVVGMYLYVRWKYLDLILRIFGEKPLFIIPRGEPVDHAEDVEFQTADGLTLKGCYIQTDRPRRGVILFGVEYGSNRWSCLQYCESLLRIGYDIFSYEPRNQGDSQGIQGYEPLQWITKYEQIDAEAAIAYLKSRPDADPAGIGIFGISKGANAGLMAAAKDQYVRCVVTDGAFGTYSTMLPYMRKWITIYNNQFLVQGLLPAWFYGSIALAGVRAEGRRRGVRFLHVENAVRKLDRPLLMIHGANDTYIKVEMARAVYKKARGLKDFWVVENARHNQAMHVAGEEYARRVVSFFDYHLAGLEPGTAAIGATIMDPTPTLNESVVAVASAQAK